MAEHGGEEEDELPHVDHGPLNEGGRDKNCITDKWTHGHIRLDAQSIGDPFIQR